MNILTLFIILNVINVIIQTVKSLATINCGKSVAALVNAVAYGLYTVVLVYMNCDLALWQKVLVVGGANLVGVFVVKFIEERARKERLWKIEMAISKDNISNIDYLKKEIAVPCNYQEAGNFYIFNCYCYTKEETTHCKNIAKVYHAKISAYEAKTL